MTIIIILAILAAVAYFVVKSKAVNESIDSLKNTVEKVEAVAAPLVEEVKEVVEKAAEVAPKNNVVKQVKKAVDKVPSKKAATKKPVNNKKPVKKQK